MISNLEKEGISLTHEGGQKGTKIEELQESEQELKVKLAKESSERQQLQLDHATLIQRSKNQQDTIESLNNQIAALNESLEAQRQETLKYKGKKLQLKDSLKNAEDDIGRHLSQISDFERALADSQASVREQDLAISEKKQTVDALQTKLKETQRTL